MIEVLSTLSPLAQAAVETPSANPVPTILGAVLPALAGAAIGYLFGILRDLNKSKAERRARHHDEVLTASTVLLETSSAITHMNVAMSAQEWEKEGLEGYIVSDADHTARMDQERRDALKAVSEWRTEARPALLKLKVLAPSLRDHVDAVWETTEKSAPEPKYWEALLNESDRTNTAFTSAVQEYLKVTPAASPTRWRPWIRRPFQWCRTVLQKPRRLFLE